MNMREYWDAQGCEYGFDVVRPKHRWLGKWREFWTQKGGLYRSKRFEVSNSFGFAIRKSQYSGHTLNINIIWPDIFIKWGNPDEGDFECPQYGFSFFEGDIHYGWGKTKVFTPPWRKNVHEGQYFHKDGHWVDMPDKYGEFDEADHWQIIEKFFYRTRYCEKQEGTARIRVQRRRWTPVYRQFWKSKWKTTIDVSFSCEVGNRAGSWKGGTIGCGYELKPNETPTECFKRMMRERNFDR